ncbi:Putative ferric reductase, NAD binding domain, ferric reductase transmembrane component-like protein [Septoria linicola]|uniref:ferric-chelate reductase (NADPH) n=1 Tax=Septoria linicola TaxID=215465 RepID=A0A9Q9EG62_9PEZI|nr:Putative ferric reductase, NAD binding domain, ferric reductase transmembrane component-like protein [Septoria linicola]
MASSNDHVLVARQHIQNHSEANTYYWAYPSRTLPCTKDAGTCAYLDQVYNGHVLSMEYTFILWGVILGILLLWAISRIWRSGQASHGASALLFEMGSKLQPLRRHFLPDAPMRWLFGRVSRLQVTVLAVMLAYLLIFSLIGISYQTWVTPIPGSTHYNTRTSLGPWSDRVGALAFALTPLAILLCMRESVLSLITGIPYQHFNFLHRWLGRVIFVQSLLHAIGWTIIEAKLYQPQPSVYVKFIQQRYVIFGCIAIFFISFLTVFSLKPVIRWTGYEFFKVTHWIIAVLYIGACWGHWDKLYCWMVPSLALIVLDQAVRGFRTLYIHFGGKKGSGLGFTCAQAELQVLTDDNGTVLRLDFDYEHRNAGGWEAGQHFYLTFPSLSIWQAHPYTVSSVPNVQSKVQHHTYLIRVRDGQTKKLAALGHGATVPVILSGPYGHGFPSYEAQHVLAMSGGTGVTFTWPIIMEAVRQNTHTAAVLDFVWVVRKAEDLLWLSSELNDMKKLLAEALGLRISIFVSRDVKHAVGKGKEKSPERGDGSGSGSEKEKNDGIKTSVSSLSGRSSIISLDDLLASSGPRFQVHWLKDHHPSIAELVLDFTERAKDFGGGLEVVGSGPEAMGSDLRAACSKVVVREDLKLYWDSRE